MRRVVLFALMFAVLPSLAEAACPRGAQCGRVTVPLDHTGATPGTLSIAYALVPATGARTGTIVFLAGGPGQAALPLTADVASCSSRCRQATTSSWSTSAARATPARSSARRVEECAERLGVRRAFLTTAETAHDLETCGSRSAADKLTLLGVSYGTKVAAEYARRYPDRTAALVLDSPVPVDGLDAFGQLRMLSAPAGAAGGRAPRVSAAARSETRARRSPRPSRGFAAERCAARSCAAPGASTAWP